MRLKKWRKQEEKEPLEEIGKIHLQQEFEEETEYSRSQHRYLDLCYPSGIDVTNPSYILVDDTYISCLLCMELPYTIQDNFLDELQNAGEGIELVLRHTPVNKAEAVKDITHYLGFTRYKMQKGESQQDSQIQENAASHSQYMKKQLAEGDEFWYISLIIKISAQSEEELKKKITKVEGILASKDIFAKKADFRQLEAFLATLPVDKEKIHPNIMKQTQRNILTSGLCAFYPFKSATISDTKGIFLGTNQFNKDQVIIDIFNTKKYNNANMLLVGASGSGKTFTTQMVTNRFRMQKIPVMMICPLKGHEYRPLCEAVGGSYFRFAAGSNSTVNMYDIRPTKNIEKADESWLAVKLQKLRMLHRLMLPEITGSQLNRLEGIVLDIYQKKGIVLEDNSNIYVKKPGVISLTPEIKEMPVLEDVYDAMKGILELEQIRVNMEPFIKGSMSFLNGRTNVNLDSIYVVSDISDMPKEWMSLAMAMITDLYWDRIKSDLTQKIAIVLDEIWHVAGSRVDPVVAEFVEEIWKTIRGYAGCAIAATQDIQDLSSQAGRAIVNQSKIKIALQMEEQEAIILQKVLGLSDEETSKIIHFNKGEGLLYAGNNHLAVNLTPFESEKKYITTDREERIKYGMTQDAS